MSQDSEEKRQPIEVVKVYGRKVWLEHDLLGHWHVMVQHDAPGTEPFQYASFYYNYFYNSNAGVQAEAEHLATRLGAKPPFVYKERSIEHLFSRPDS